MYINIYYSNRMYTYTCYTYTYHINNTYIYIQNHDILCICLHVHYCVNDYNNCCSGRVFAPAFSSAVHRETGGHRGNSSLRGLGRGTVQDGPLIACEVEIWLWLHSMVYTSDDGEKVWKTGLTWLNNSMVYGR